MIVCKAGDRVTITIGEQSVRARVVLASSNGRSLMLEFDAILELDRGCAVGMLPIFYSEPEGWYEILTHMPVTLEVPS